jgi:hypothetical protein
MLTGRRPTTPVDRLDINDGVTAREFDGEWVVLDLQGGNYYGLNKVGGIVWQHLAAGQSPQEISGLLTPRLNVPEERLLADILKLVEELLKHGLVRLDG